MVNSKRSFVSNPKTLKRQSMTGWNGMNAIGAPRQTMGVDKMGSVKSPFQQLKANKKPLSMLERAKVMAADATWHHGPNGEPTPAVWKSVDKTGKVTYVTNTHRAFNARPTLRGAIARYHNFIKGTA